MTGKHNLQADSSKQASILVIDDSDIDRQVMVELLQSGGFTVHDLPSPIGATRKARELQVKAVVIDQNLPSLDGSKLAVLFRSNAGLQDLKVVLVSSADEATMVEIAKRASADAFVSKKQLHDTLLQTLRRLLK